MNIKTPLYNQKIRTKKIIAANSLSARPFGIIYAVLILFIIFGLLFFSEQVANGIKEGILLCSNILIPAVFPFMVLAAFLTKSPICATLSVPLVPITTKIFKLPKEYGALIFLSLIGGFPVGGKMVADLLEEKKIDVQTANRMLCFCVNPAPAFVINAVGISLLKDKTAGIILLFSSIVATVIIGAVVSQNIKVFRNGSSYCTTYSTASNFVNSVKSAANATIVMSAFAILFSGILALAKASGFLGLLSDMSNIDKNIITAFFASILEICSGVAAGIKLNGELAFIFLNFSISICGLSIIFQIMSFFTKYKVKFKLFIISRFFHFLISCAISVPLYNVFCNKTLNTSAANSAPFILANNNALVLSVCLIIMSSILILFSYNK